MGSYSRRQHTPTRWASGRSGVWTYHRRVPELPEVETVRRTLAPMVLGATVSRAEVRRADVVRGDRSTGALLTGSVIDRIDRRGKQLALVGSGGRCVCVHLGMTGRLTLLRERPGREEPHLHCLWTLETGRGTRWMAFSDPRRFGGIWTFPSFGALEEARWSALGPDATVVGAEEFAARLRRARRPLKSALLDQGLIAGLGNIYADEALYAAMLGPRRMASRVTAEEAARLHASIREILAAAIEAGGSTVRDYANGDGQPGWFQVSHAVYGRGGEECLRCGRALRETTLGGRTTVYCPVCQSVRGAAQIAHAKRVVHNRAGGRGARNAPVRPEGLADIEGGLHTSSM